MQGSQHPPTFSAAEILESDDTLHDWLNALAAYGCSLLRGVPDGTDVGDVARRIGPIRDTNFGTTWDVIAEPGPVTNANTALALPPHVDLPTREYQPGIHLHCLINEAQGGESVLVDGFRLAQEVRETRPDHYELLTNLRWDWANRSRTSDYRSTSPIFVTNHLGDIEEVRFGNWLRAPLTSVPFDQVEQAYAAYRYVFALSFDQRFAIRFLLAPGDCMVFDNRRILHGRNPFHRVGDGTYVVATPNATSCIPGYECWHEHPASRTNSTCKVATVHGMFAIPCTVRVPLGLLQKRSASCLGCRSCHRLLMR